MPTQVNDSKRHMGRTLQARDHSSRSSPCASCPTAWSWLWRQAHTTETEVARVTGRKRAHLRRVADAMALRATLEYARHGRSIGGESPLEEEVVLTPSRRQLRRREAGWEGSPRRIPAPRNTNRV